MVYSVLRLTYYDGQEEPGVFLRVPGTSTKVLPNSIADLVPISSGNITTLTKVHKVIGKPYRQHPFVDDALLKKTATFKINANLDFSFLPEIKQD